MTYIESIASIQRNNWFRDRVTEAVSVYSNYLLNTPTDDTMYEEKVASGKQLSNQYATIVDTLMFTLSGDSEIIQAGPAISDAQLQQIVEKTILKFYPVQATLAPGIVGHQVNVPKVN